MKKTLRVAIFSSQKCISIVYLSCVTQSNSILSLLSTKEFNFSYIYNLYLNFVTRVINIYFYCLFICFQNHQHLCGQQSNENAISTQRPMTPQQSCTNNDDEESSESDECRPCVSVRDLASRFEGSNSSNNPKCSTPRDQQSERQPPHPGNLGRMRSKSESDFRTMEVKPKSVLSRNKQKNKVSRMKKSVTFNDNIALVDLLDMFSPPDGATGYNDTGYVSDEEDIFNMATRSYSDNEIDDYDSADSPTEINPGEVPCSLCGKHGAQYAQYCEKCHFYLRQFQPQLC